MSGTTPNPEPTLAQRVTEWAQPITAYLVLGSFAGALVLAYLYKDADSVRGMVSAVQTLTSIVVGYYFGSSRGSAAKDRTIAAVALSPTPTSSGTTTTTTGASP